MPIDGDSARFRLPIRPPSLMSPPVRRAGARFEKGVMVEREQQDQEAAA